jgi:16S rRNA (guanine(966)-N(2))-methyltransferase RsmD
MRVTGGTARGQQLFVPKNFISRPTTDMVRQAIFSMLASFREEWVRGLDLFAGTGALGIEALSRGIEWVDFVDREPRSCAIIKRNLERLGYKDKSHVYCLAVLKALKSLQHTYDVVFMDPPYADTSLGDVLANLGESGSLTGDAVIVVTHTSRTLLADEYGMLKIIKQKRHGDTGISIYQREELH